MPRQRHHQDFRLCPGATGQRNSFHQRLSFPGGERVPGYPDAGKSADNHLPGAGVGGNADFKGMAEDDKGGETAVAVAVFRK